MLPHLTCLPAGLISHLGGEWIVTSRPKDVEVSIAECSRVPEGLTLLTGQGGMLGGGEG